MKHSKGTEERGRCTERERERDELKIRRLDFTRSPGRSGRKEDGFVRFYCLALLPRVDK